jgi:hypothetical protein
VNLNGTQNAIGPTLRKPVSQETISSSQCNKHRLLTHFKQVYDSLTKEVTSNFFIYYIHKISSANYAVNIASWSRVWLHSLVHMPHRFRLMHQFHLPCLIIRTGYIWVTLWIWYTAVKIRWHMRRNQILSFSETDESMWLGGGDTSVDYWQPSCAGKLEAFVLCWRGYAPRSC